MENQLTDVFSNSANPTITLKSLIIGIVGIYLCIQVNTAVGSVTSHIINK